MGLRCLASAGAGPFGLLRARTAVAASGLLVATVTGGVSAEPPAVLRLLEALDLRGYPRGTQPPQFSGETLHAGSVSLAQHRGSIVILNFWASWCLECRAEMPAFERLRREFSRRGFVVIGVNAHESKDTIGRYARSLGLTFPIVLDRNGTINARYGVIGLPTTFIIGRDGRAVAFAVGPQNWEGAAGRALLEALLAEMDAEPATR